MNVIFCHEEPQKLLEAVAAEIGEGHPLVAALRDAFERFKETDERVRDLELRLDRSRVPR